MNVPSYRLLDNPTADPQADYGDAERAILNRSAFGRAAEAIRAWPAYRPTPLLELPNLAHELRVGMIFYKDEGQRLGLKSFKALGGAYAVLCIVRERLGVGHSVADNDGPVVDWSELKARTQTITVTAATDGNHGRSVAWAAGMFGCRCVIFLNEHVSAVREREIAKYGAEIRRVTGNYEDSVRACVEEAGRRGWTVIQDTSLPDHADPIPCLIMQGYQLLIDEALDQMPRGVTLTHVFVQAGVGGLAAAVAGYFWERFGARRPRIVAVEPLNADCVYRSIEAGRPTPVPGDANSFMACLSAGQVSPSAWPILQRGIDHVLALHDDWAPRAMRRLARNGPTDQPIVAGESGCASTAGLMAVAGDVSARARLNLDASSNVLLIGSEGATDEETYRRIVGKSSAEVESTAVS